VKRAIRFAAAVFDGFLLGFDSWELWNYVGPRTRVAADHAQLEQWRNTLSKRFRAIESFHAELAACFYKHVGDHRQFDSRRHRLFVDQIVSDCSNTVSALVALALAGARPVARFQNKVFTEQLPKSRANIHAALAAAFPDCAFEVVIADSK
jgi:hypothetical protein